MDIFQEVLTNIAKDGKTPLKEVNERTMRALGGLAYGECESIIDEVYGTGWFTSIVANEAHNRLVEGFNTIPPEWRKVVSDITTLDDLKQRRATTFSGAPYLPSRDEYEGYESIEFKDRGETYTPGEYGRIFSISRKAKANDQIGAFQRWAVEEGKAAGRSINRYVFYNLLSYSSSTNGRGMTLASDSTEIFTSAHGNLKTSASTFTRANIQLALTGLFSQTGEGGERLAFNGPFYLVINSTHANLYIGYDLTAQNIRIGGTSAIYSEPNLHGTAGQLPVQVVPTPYTAVTADVYLIAGDAPTFEIGFYEGKQTPELVQEQMGTGFAFTHDQYRWRATMAFGGTCVEYRSMYMLDAA